MEIVRFLCAEWYPAINCKCNEYNLYFPITTTSAAIIDMSLGWNLPAVLFKITKKFPQKAIQTLFSFK